MDRNKFNYLMNIRKLIVNKRISLPLKGEVKEFELISEDEREKFLLDVDRRGRIELKKVKLQNRYSSIPLVRLEIDAPPHLFPDGSKSSRNHIHFYNPDTDSNDTFDLEDLREEFRDINNFYSLFINFCECCTIETNNLQGVI